MKVGIIGLGFVGKALLSGIKKNTEVIKIDPRLNTTINDLEKFNPDVAFVCIPTPMMDDGNQEIEGVKKIIGEISQFMYKPLIVVKSTILPNNALDLKKRYSNIVFNPEFLRERHAKEDFINSKTIIFGGDKKNCLKLSSFYKNHTNCLQKDYIFTDEISACLIKYSINSFLATKVIFFNELKRIFEKSDSSEMWSQFISYISTDERIGESHMMVPGPDGRNGFGGACFPKDSSALHKYSQYLDAEFMLLKKAISINNNIRSEYNNLIDREKEQNIKYKD